MISRRSSLKEAQIADLLTEVVDVLDIPPDVLAAAIARYEELGAALADWADDRNGAPWFIYPQGSMLLGTMVRPHQRNGEYDVDLVCRHEVFRDSVTKDELKKLVGDGLQAYVDSLNVDAPRLDEGKRCWTLTYGQQFHMDVLPAVPRASRTGTGLWITDRNLWEWQETDPKAYAEWFRDRMRRQFDEVRAELAKREGSKVEDIRPERVRTALQRAVQVIKRHRDIYFAERPELRPPSVLLTTLTAHSYNGTPNVYEAVRVASETMHNFITHDAEGPCVVNPVCDENFADRWRTAPDAQSAFRAWQRKLADDAKALGAQSGMVEFGQVLKTALGNRPVELALTRIGNATREHQSSQGLVVTTTGMVSTSAAFASDRSVPQHKFFGA